MSAIPKDRVSRPVTRRHRCEVTADRIGDHLYDDAITARLSGADLDLLSQARWVLVEIAAGTYETTAP